MDAVRKHADAYLLFMKDEEPKGGGGTREVGALFFLCVCQCRAAQNQQVYLMGQVAPLCLKSYLQRAEALYVQGTGEERWRSAGSAEKKEKRQFRSQV